MGSEKDIKFQIPVEVAISVELARRNGGLILPNKPGRNSKNDFTIYVPVRYEVKCDYMAKQTRNAFFEVRNCRLKEPSGLSATAADWWIHYIPGDAVFYRFNPKKLLAWLEKESRLTLVTGKGDSNSDGYIVPLEILAKLKFVTTFPFMA